MGGKILLYLPYGEDLFFLSLIDSVTLAVTCLPAMHSYSQWICNIILLLFATCLPSK